MMSAHDRYLSNYHRGFAQVWCSNLKCELHKDGIEVDTETEYGQTVLIPEECPVCHSYWLDDEPKPEEED